MSFPASVVVAVESGPALLPSLQAAKRIAGSSGAKLRFVHVVAGTPALVKKFLGTRRIERAELNALTELRAALAQAAASCGLSPSPELEVMKGDPADVLVELARKDDLLVLGVKGGGQAGQPYGSTARRLVRAARGPLLCIQERPSRGEAYRKVLVAIDDTASGRRALEVAHDLATRERAALEALHVYEPPARGLLDLLDDEAEAAQVAAKIKGVAAERMASVLARVSPAPPLALVEGFHPARRVAPYAELNSHDLIVIGSRVDPTRKDFVLGDVADELLALTTRDVLVVKTEA